jgi:hypothetical protein
MSALGRDKRGGGQVLWFVHETGVLDRDIKIDARVEWIFTSEGARLLVVTLSGRARINGIEISRWPQSETRASGCM